MMTRLPGRLLGLDLGERRIGVAVSDELGLVASPVDTIDRRTDVPRALRRLVEQYQAVALVAGLPVSLSGREGPQAEATREYTDVLAAEVGLPVEFWDERLSTSIAERSLIASGSSRKKRKTQVDAVAASIILQSYLDHARWMSDNASHHRGRSGQ